MTINSNLIEIKEYLNKKYSIVSYINLNNFTHPSDLYDQISLLQTKVFSKHERIVFVYSENKIKYLLELLDHLDIPKLFVILLIPTNHQLPKNFDEIKVMQYLQTNEDIFNNKTFDIPSSHCIYPWVNIEINTTGNISPCCRMHFKDKTLTIQSNSFNKIYLSSEFTNIRDNFRQNLQTQECKECWTLEAAGITSMRQQAKYKLKDIYYKIDFTEENYNNLQMFDLKLGNNCNLSCGICDEFQSSSIAKLKLKNKIISLETFNNLKKLSSWSDSDTFYNQILEIAPRIQYLNLYGGEPFMNKSHMKFLEKLIKLQVSNKISIDYNSNGTFYSEKFFDLWQYFKKVKISFSIDDIEERFEVQRNGANWAKVQENIIKYNKKTADNFITDVFATVNIQNVYYLPELLQWISQQKFSERFSFNILIDPPQLAINNLPNFAKFKIKEKLAPYPELSSIIEQLMTPINHNYDPKNFLENLYQNRDKDFSKAHKEFVEILTKNN
jgi:radical SAM protein with 4Fe4S-binding SPASM domain